MATEYVPQHQWQPQGVSQAETFKAKLRAMGPKAAKAWWDALTEQEAVALKCDWDFWARPEQQAPPPNYIDHPLGWQFWVVLAGRGTGKTRTAAELMKREILAGRAKYPAICGPTYRDTIQTMLKGESGLISVFQGTGVTVKHSRGDNTVTFTRGNRVLATAQTYTGEEPERFRGPQHDFAWFDEFGACDYQEEIWALYNGSQRLGDPRAVFTTTPRASLLKTNLLQMDRTVVTFGKTDDNAGNLAAGYVETLREVYGDTDFGSQEIDGRLFLDASGAPFKSEWIQKHRVAGPLRQVGTTWHVGDTPMTKTIVAVDPSGSSKKTACECGIVVAGLDANRKVYILRDLSFRDSPDAWARVVVQAATQYDASVVCEANFGAEMVPTIIRSAAKDLGVKVAIKEVTAQKDKAQRAMLASPHVQKGTVRFVGLHTKLEQQMTLWEPGKGSSPDRMDAAVWAILDLAAGQAPRGVVEMF